MQGEVVGSRSVSSIYNAVTYGEYKIKLKQQKEGTINYTLSLFITMNVDGAACSSCFI
jgi:hypothetical protein